MKNLEKKSETEYFGNFWESSVKERILGIYRATKRAFQEIVNVYLGVEYTLKKKSYKFSS